MGRIASFPFKAVSVSYPNTLYLDNANFNPGVQSFTIDAIENVPFATHSTIYIFSKLPSDYYNPGSSSPGYAFFITSNNYLSFTMRANGNPNTFTTTSTTALTINTWYHVKLIVDRTLKNVRFYLNGRLIHTANFNL